MSETVTCAMTRADIYAQLSRASGIESIAYLISDREIGTLDTIRALITPIKTLDTAQAWATINGYGATCDSASPNASQTNADYYELRRIYGACKAGANGRPVNVMVETIYLVYRDGRLEARPSRDLRISGPCPIVGRRPTGLAENATASNGTLAAYLAQIAHLESAAVFAFHELASELARHGAPEQLVARARLAAQDEVRHAQVITRHARAFGAEPTLARVVAKPYGSLFELALHNVEEGCVRETYGALVAMHQAKRATEIDILADFAHIARDEMRHAEWSHDVHAWLMTQLTDQERSAVVNAGVQALTQLERECAIQPAAELISCVGLPSAKIAVHMLAELKGALGI